jgi:cytoskeletal protein RodZ
MSYNKDEDSKKSNQSEDDFGLPNLDYKPLDTLEGSSSQSGNSPYVDEYSSRTTQGPYNDSEGYVSHSEKETKSKAPIFITVIVVLVFLVGGFLAWKYVIEPRNKKAEQEQLAREKAIKEKEEQDRLAKIREEEERQRLAAEAEAANAQPKEGSIEVLNSPTRRYYVVITSAVDADLTMDYAKKLSAKGVSSKIIPPFGKWKFNRLSIGDYDTFASAQSQADAVKPEYGDAVWVIRY